MMRTILHSDCNNFFASVECVLHPELRGRPLAVCGEKERRHGIVLAKNELAKAYGVATGDTIWQAQKKCPPLRIVTPTYGAYGEYSQRMRAIYDDYTDQVEPFGLDECWLDVTGCRQSGPQIAAEIRRRARAELGITASVGVSFNKVFAKLGSDLRKPDATTVITPENFREKLWPLPAGNLLFVGRQTRQALDGRGLYTIGDVARADSEMLRAWLGKGGETLQKYAQGLDDAPVLRAEEHEAIKSIGNSATLSRDMMNEADARLVLHGLCDQVAARLRKHGVKCQVVSLWVRDSALSSYDRQRALDIPTCLSGALYDTALALLRASYPWKRPIRSLGVRTTQLISEALAGQQSIFPNRRTERQEKLERALDDLHARFGNGSVCRAVLLTDPSLDRHTLPPPEGNRDEKASFPR